MTILLLEMSMDKLTVQYRSSNKHKNLSLEMDWKALTLRRKP